MRNILAFGAALSLVTSVPMIGRTEEPHTFSVQVNFKLCPEYKIGNTLAPIYFMRQNDDTRHSPTILEQSVDSLGNFASYTVQLPANEGAQKFRVAVTGLNPYGESDLSNQAEVSYCDLLRRQDSDGDGISDHDENQNCVDEIILTSSGRP